MELTRRFWAQEQGQDVTEFSLLLAFVVLAVSASFLVSMSSVTGIWVSANTLVNQAATAAHAS
ncbi:MAG: hypothetical protein M3O20_18190 [Acidobacteriota bacterium]|nr:hypothetical protein [Acidobacteriota bacterium]